MSSSRRQFLARTAIGAGLGLASAAAALVPTRAMQLGPFYPIEKPIDQDADLTRVAGHRGRAKGQYIAVSGRVLDVSGRPIRSAKLELWQTNAAGRYAHHGDQHNAPLDPDFQGYAVIRSGADGGYRFLTVRPAPYTAGTFMRAAHIHFSVDGQYDRLVTQMYFKDDRLLAQDQALAMDMDHAALPYPDAIFGQEQATGGSEPESKQYKFDIVLRDG